MITERSSSSLPTRPRSFAAASCGSDRPIAPSVPTCRKSRRVTPSHVWAVPRSVSLSIGRFLAARVPVFYIAKHGSLDHDTLLTTYPRPYEKSIATATYDEPQPIAGTKVSSGGRLFLRNFFYRSGLNMV